MEMYNKQAKIKDWGNHIDPEVSAEKYLYHVDEEVKKWAKENEDALQEMDKDTINLYRRHENNCDFRNMEHIAEMQQEVVIYQGIHARDPTDKWLERIYGKDPQDLPQLVSDETISAALQNLSYRQKQLVHMSAVKQMKNTEMAKKLHITDRSIRDTLQRAYAKVRKEVGESKELASPASPDLVQVDDLLVTA